MTQTDAQSNLPPEPSGGERPHRAADDREEVYYKGSPLLRGEVGRFLIFLIVGMVLIAGPLLLRFTSLDVRIPWWLLLIFVILGLMVIVFPALMLRTITYRISNYRIDFERGILSKNIDTLELWHVDDVKLHQSLLDRMLGCGTITVMSKDDTTPRLDLHGYAGIAKSLYQLSTRTVRGLP